MGWQVVYVPFLFAGNTIINTSGVYVYSSTPGVGDLIASILSASGTDQFDNATRIGTNSYVAIGPLIMAVGLNALGGSGAVPGLSIQDVASLPNQPAGVFGEASSNGTGPTAFLQVSSGAETAADVASQIELDSQLQSAITGGKILMTAGEIIHFLSSLAITYSSNSTGSILATETGGDGNTYHLGHFATRNNSVPLTISSTTATTVLTIGNLEAGKGYHIRGFALYIGNQAAGAPVFSWNDGGGLVLGTQQNGWQDFEGGGVAPVIHNNNGALGAVTGPAFAAATTNWLYRWEIYVNVTTSGSLLVTAAEGTAGDSFVISQIYAMTEEF